MAGLAVLPFRHGPFWNFSYLIACQETRQAAVIDPAWDVPAILRASAGQGFNIRTVLLTHSHSDHANGVAEVVEASGARVYIHSEERHDLLSLYSGPVMEFENGESWELGNIPIHAFHTPGHTEGSASFWAAGRLFTGDTIGTSSAGSPGPHPRAAFELWETLRGKLAGFPPETIIHPGHDSGPEQSSALAAVRDRTAALRAETFEEFVLELERASGRRVER